MNTDPSPRPLIILNGLFLDKPGKQSGNFFMAIATFQELLRLDERYILISTEEFPWAMGRTIKVKPFKKKYRFIVESYYRNRYRNEIWLNFDYFLPYQLGAYRGKDIVVIHDLLPIDIAKSVSRCKRIWFTKQISRSLRRSYSIVTISNFCEERLKVNFPLINVPINVIGNPIDIGRFRTHHKTVLPSSSQKFFLTIAAAWPHKNLSTLVRAFETTYKLTGIPLYICGTRSELLVDALKDDSVVYLGFVSDEDLGLLIVNSVALIAPSLYEGFGMTVYEGLGLGKFVLASDLSVYIDHPNLMKVKDPEFSYSWEKAILDFLKERRTLCDVDFSIYEPEYIALKYHKLVKECEVGL